MKRTRITSLILSAAMMVSLLPVSSITAYAEYAEMESSNFAGGLGTPDNPYKIANLTQLEYFASSVSNGKDYSGAYFILTQNIDMSSKYSSSGSSWTPIGTSGTAFKGTFDGRNFTVSNLYVNGTSRGQGLFGYINNATIKNLSVTSGNVISTKDFTGGIAGSSTDSSIENCYYSGNVTCSSGGGIAGSVNEGIIKNCHTDGTITQHDANSLRLGGIAGSVNNGPTIENCYSTSSISTGKKRGHIVGGATSNQYTVNNCYCPIDSISLCSDDLAILVNSSAKDSSLFSSGEIAHLLQGNQTDKIWGQKIGVDSYPVLTNDINKAVHKVTFVKKDSTNPANNSTIAVVYANKSGVRSLPANPTAPNYTFSHWSASKDSVKFTTSSEVNSDITVYAIGKETTKEAADKSDIINLKKNQTITLANAIDLNEYVENKSGTGTKNFSFSVSADSQLPPGLSLSDGKITGTPTTVGKTDVTFNVTNNGISLMSLNGTGDKLTLKFDVSLIGNGSETDPYIIYNLRELEYFRDKVNSGYSYSGEYVKLDSSVGVIDMSDTYGDGKNSWEPIGVGGDEEKPFEGTFDGNNKEIKGLYVSNGSYSFRSLFGYVKSGTVKNLSVSGKVSGKHRVGGIVGSISNSGLIENCYSSVEITAYGNYVGGIAGSNAYDSEIKNCCFTGSISGALLSGYTGGISGVPNTDEVINSYYLRDGISISNDHGTAMTNASFTSGEVAYLLQGNQTNLVWGQSLNSTSTGFPVLTTDTSKKVYKISFCADNEGDGVYTAYDTDYANNNTNITVPSYSSQAFKGWSCDPNGTAFYNSVYAFNESRDLTFYSVWKTAVKFAVTNQNQVYNPNTAKEISFVPQTNDEESQELTQTDFTVKYYEVNENDDVLASSSPVSKAVTSGKYLYVIDFKDDTYKTSYYIKRCYNVTSVTLPDINSFDNIGYLYISSAGIQQEPISFTHGSADIKVGDTYTNTLNNNNDTTPVYSTSNRDIATVDSNGTVTAHREGSVTITAKSEISGASTVYASYILNITKIPVTVTADDKSVSYGDTSPLTTTVTYSTELDESITDTLSFTTTYSYGKPAGEYLITPCGLVSEKYSFTYVPATLTVTPKEIRSFTITANTKKYDTTTAATATVSDIPDVLPADKDFVNIYGNAEFDTADSGTNKTVTFTASGLSGTKAQNYVLKETANTAEAKADITPLRVDFSIGRTTFVYDENNSHELTVYATDENGKTFSGYTVVYKLNGSPLTAAPKDAGTYTAKISLNDTDNYYTSQGDVTLKIENATADALVIEGLPGTVRYGDSFPLYAVGGESDGDYEWSVKDGADVTINVDESDNSKATVTVGDVVNTRVEIEVKKKTQNYDDVCAKVAFVPTAKVVTFTVNNTNIDYGDTKRFEVTPSDASATYTVKYNGSETHPTNAGTYNVTVEAYGKYTGTLTSSLVINKKTATGEINNLRTKYTYGEEITGIYATSTMGSGIEPTITYLGTGIYVPQSAPPKKAGNYTVIATFTDSNNNYETLTVTKSFEIEKAVLTVKAADVLQRPYGEANPVFTLEYSGFKYGENKDALIYEPIATTDANASSDAGEYPITVSGGAAENYKFNYDNSGKIIVTKVGGNMYIAGPGSIYVGDTCTLQAYIGSNKANVTWSLDENSDSSIVTFDQNGNFKANKAGTVKVIATAGGNYNVTPANFTLTVKKTNITLTPTSLVKTYNGNRQDISFESTSEFNPVVGENVTVRYECIGNPSVTEPKNAGTYSVIYTVNDDKYSGSGSFIFNINKADLTLKVTNRTKIYGSEFTDYSLEIKDCPVQMLQVEVDNLIAAVTPLVSFTSEGAAKEAPVKDTGYDIIPVISRNETDNFKFNVEKGTLTVKKATLTIKPKDVTREYNTDNPELEAEYNGFVNNESKDVLSGRLILKYDDSINLDTKVGYYPDSTAAEGTIIANNYDVHFQKGNVTVTGIPVSVSAVSAKSTRIIVKFDKALKGLNAENFTVTYDGGSVDLTKVTPSSDNRAYTLNGTFTAGTEYTVTITLSDTSTDDNASLETHAITSGNPLTVIPSSSGSGSGNGGGGGGGATKPVTYNIVFNSNGGSSVDTVKAEKNSVISEPTVPVKDGFKFDGWYSDAKLNNVYDFNTKVTKNITLYAKWTEIDKDTDDDNNQTPSEPQVPDKWSNPFTDVSEYYWYFENVKYVNEHGLMDGLAENIFAPDSFITRGMFVTVLYRAEGEPTVSTNIPFADVTSDKYYAKAVAWANQNGIVKGVSEAEFAPEDNITREQIATIMLRYASYLGIAAENTSSVSPDYADFASISDYAKDAVTYCTSNGIMQGKDNNLFAPKDNATRAEFAAILNRFIEANK